MFYLAYLYKYRVATARSYLVGTLGNYLACFLTIFFSLNYIYWSTNRKSMGCPKVSYGLSARNYQICAIFCQFLPILLLPCHRNCKYLGLNFMKFAKFTVIISSNIMLNKIYEKKLDVI